MQSDMLLTVLPAAANFTSFPVGLFNEVFIKSSEISGLIIKQICFNQASYVIQD